MGTKTDLTRCFPKSPIFPTTGSAEEQEQFHIQQTRFVKQFEQIFPDIHAARTVVIIPSLTLDKDLLGKVKGAPHYEERMLCMLMLLRMPRTKVVFVSSLPIPDCIIDYYLHLLPGITGTHAKKRLITLSCNDHSCSSLTEKILNRPRLIERIRKEIDHPDAAHLSCFNVTHLEKQLAVRLGIPLYGTDPDLFYEGTKSGSRKAFRAAGVDLPDGHEDLYSKQEVIHALATLKLKYPQAQKAVIKLNDGFSGDGNAIYTYPSPVSNQSVEKNIEDHFRHYFHPVAADVTEKAFFLKLSQMGGIVEMFVDGEVKTSPSVQCIINPRKEISIVSTHDQVLGGADGQIFLGACFPAAEAYNVSLAQEGRKIAEVLAQKGVLGRFAIDFMSVQQADKSWRHFAIEINIRKGGTTHPYLMLKFLTDGHYDEQEGRYLTASGNQRYYFTSDNVTSDRYKGLTPEDLIELAMFHHVMYDGATQEGVMLHMLGATSEFGKLGLVCIGSSPERAKAFYNKTIDILNFECSE